VVAAIGFLSAGAVCGVKEFHVAGLKEDLDAAVELRRSELAEERDRIEKALNTRLSDEELVSGRLAASRHAEEWQRREAYDIRYAANRREKLMARMARLARWEELPQAPLLRKIAWMAAPTGSRVSVSEGPEGSAVYVKFNMASLAEGEGGADTKHRTIGQLKAEVVNLTARVIKDLYGTCGWTDIGEIRVACTHGVRVVEPGALRNQEAGPVVNQVLYEASVSGETARKHANFKRHKPDAVGRHLRVIRDEFAALTIRSLVWGDGSRWRGGL